jgi:hypothetical protein
MGAEMGDEVESDLRRRIDALTDQVGLMEQDLMQLIADMGRLQTLCERAFTEMRARLHHLAATDESSWMEMETHVDKVESEVRNIRRRG